MERYELAKNRIMELETEIDGAFGDYIKVQKTQNSEKNGQTIFTKK